MQDTTYDRAGDLVILLLIFAAKIAASVIIGAWA